jgi:hypothetical protein
MTDRSFRAHGWLATIAGPDRAMYDYLRSDDVDLGHVINLTQGMLACRE